MGGGGGLLVVGGGGGLLVVGGGGGLGVGDSLKIIKYKFI